MSLKSIWQKVSTNWYVGEAFEIFMYLCVSVPPILWMSYQFMFPQPDTPADDDNIGGLHAIKKRGEVSPSNSELLNNTIGFGVVSIILFIMRMANRIWVLKKTHKEDYFMCLTMFYNLLTSLSCFYISLLILINFSAHYATNLYPPEQAASIFADPTDVQSRIFGSKLVIPLEQCMLASTWGVKLCIWFFLKRVCRQLPAYQTALNYLLGYILLGYVTIMIFYYAVACRPFHQYWAMPVQNLQCATYQHYSIVQMVFNLTSDFALITIPIKMVTVARLPRKRRLLIMVPFLLASFTIIAAILNKAFNFASPMTTTYQLWYIRESSVAIWVGNIICCWQLFQKLFKWRSFDDQRPDIDPEPEMARRDRAPRRDEHQSLFSTHGTWRERFGKLGIWGSGATTENTSEATAVDEKRTGVSTVMALKDGEDDATAAIAYRNQHNIV